MRIILKGISVAAAAAFFTGSLAAQNTLYVEHQGAFRPVRQVVGTQAFVEENSQLIKASGHKYALRNVEEYAPYLVTLRKIEASSAELSSPIGASQAGVMASPTLKFRAELESAYALEHLFLVLELRTESHGRAVFVRELGNLEPYKPIPFEIFEPLEDYFGRWSYTVHIFASGHEVLNSRMKPDYIENVLDRMVAKRIKGKTEAPPAPFIGPSPNYRAASQKTKMRVVALVSMTIAANGSVVAPQLERASEPEFGAAAIAAARLWRFLPQVKNGRAVEAKVEMPFVFAPEADAAQKR